LLTPATVAPRAKVVRDAQGREASLASTGFNFRGLDENGTHERRGLPNMRQLRVFLAVSNSASMQAAASDLNTSRSSITKAIKKLETQVGAALLVRTSRRHALTPAGSVVAAAARRLFDCLQAAEVEIAATIGGPRRRFAQNFTNSQLAAFLGVISHRSHTLAAIRLKVSQPAITMALRDLQNSVGVPLLEKGPEGVVPNAMGLVLADAVRRVASELEDMCDVVKLGPREARERVVVGVTEVVVEGVDGGEGVRL
jgi:LysR family transcriptional regulator of gallate degradation